MNEHKTVVDDQLRYLYARIHNPTASDRERLRIARRALDRLAPDAQPFDAATMTVTEVREAVEAGKVSFADALASERSGKNRSSLITWLEGEGN